jgi:hypothetical protein
MRVVLHPRRGCGKLEVNRSKVDDLPTLSMNWSKHELSTTAD